MTCGAWRDRMLEADPAELRGREATPLAAHLAACADCAAVARRILEGEAGLDAALGGLAAEAGRGAGYGEATEYGETQGGGVRARRWRKVLPWAVPVALAAAAGGVWLGVRGGRSVAPGGAGVVEAPAESGQAGRSARPGAPDAIGGVVGAGRAAGGGRGGVAVSAARDYVVFQTDDPDIAVVWFLTPRRGL